MNNKITFPELTELLSEVNGTSRRVSEKFLKEFFAILQQTLESGESVKIKHFGTFKVTKVEARKSVHVSTGQEIEIPEYHKITFTPDKEVSEAVNKPFAGFETIELDDNLTETDVKSLSDIQIIETGKHSETVTDNSEKADGENIESEANTTDVNNNAVGEQKEQSHSAEETTGNQVIAIPDDAIESDTEIPETPAIEENGNKIEETDEIADKTSDVIESDTESKHRESEDASEKDNFETVNTIEYIDNKDEHHHQEQRPIYKSRRFKKGYFWGVLSGAFVAFVAVILTSYFSGFPIIVSKTETIQEAIQDTTNVATSSTAAKTDSSTIITENKISEKVETIVTDTISRTKFLTTMARKYYGNFNFWVYIYEENKSKIDNPNKISPGTVVIIPPAEKYGINKDNPESIAKAKEKASDISNKFNN